MISLKPLELITVRRVHQLQWARAVLSCFYPYSYPLSEMDRLIRVHEILADTNVTVPLFARPPLYGIGEPIE